MSSTFRKTVENFRCGNCNITIVGNGYTNHCPKCLWSKHVDVNPGDREETCQGMMKPVEVFLQDKKYILLHKCTACGIEKKNKISEDDNFDSILKISEEKSL